MTDMSKEHPTNCKNSSLYNRGKELIAKRKIEYRPPWEFQHHHSSVVRSVEMTHHSIRKFPSQSSGSPVWELEDWAPDTWLAADGSSTFTLVSPSLLACALGCSCSWIKLRTDAKYDCSNLMSGIDTVGNFGLVGYSPLFVEEDEDMMT